MPDFIFTETMCKIKCGIFMVINYYTKPSTIY